MVAAAFMAVTTPPAHAAPPSEIAVGAGVCAVTGTVTEQFSPSVGALPSTVQSTLSGSALCAGDPVTNTITINLTTSALLSCAGGEGTLAGSASFSTGFPPFSTMTGLYYGTPGSEVFELTGQNLTLVGALAWSPLATATCPVSRTVSTPLYGSLVYVYA